MRINEYLKKNNIAENQFANMCGLPYETVNDICEGRTDIAKCTGETLLKIAGVLGVSVDRLLSEKVTPSCPSLSEIEKAVWPIAEKYRLRSVYIFGSYARNEANEDSDIDILIDREGSEVSGLFEMGALFNDLKDALKKEIDLVTLQSLRQKESSGNNNDFAETVMREMIKIYG